jgi:hypothetical protein
MLSICGSTWQERMKVIENEELDNDVKRIAANEIKVTAMMVQAKLVAKFASEVEDVLKKLMASREGSSSSSSSSSSRDALSSPLSSPFSSPLSSFTLISSSRRTRRSDNVIENEKESPFEELRLQIIRISNTFNSMTEVNMR